MDFIKKFAEEKMESMGNQNQNQNQGYDQEESYGQQQQGYGQQENYGQQQGYGQQESYGNENQGGYGGQQEYGNTGGEQYNRPHGEGGAYGGNSGGVPQINQSAAVEAANAHASNGNENSSLFSSAFSRLGQMSQDDDNDVDEDAVQEQHAQAYNGNASALSAGGMGSAAALQALKSFTSGSSGASSSGGGDMQSKIIGMAMSEAAKLFDQSGGAAQGTKQDAVTSAGQTIMKLMLKQQMSGMMGGGNSGGLSSLMGMASKFM